MASVDNFDEELPAGGSVLQPTDKVLIHEASSGLKKYLTGDLAARGQTGVVAVTAGATLLTVTAAAHAGKVITLANTAPIAITLPAVTGTGNTYKFVVLAAATATASTINRATTADIMTGFVTALTTAAAGVVGYKTTATDNTISMNGTTSGGVVGDVWELTDIASGKWSVQGNTAPTGTTVTNFSHV